MKHKHKKIAVVAGAAAVMLAGTAWIATQDTCDPSLSNHVYNPQRLQVVKECIVTTGVVQSVRSESDGDDHIAVKLDSGQQSLLTQANMDHQNGNFVVEPICVNNQPTQTDAQAACAGFVNKVAIPSVGQHIRTVGRYVLDNQHGGWSEQHAVTSIRVI